MRRSPLPSVALLVVALLGAACAPARPERPKGILVVLVDALRADHVGLYGSTLQATPALDALGPDSVVFSRAWAQASWTRPSLPSLLTGLYPSEHGLTDFVESGSKVSGNVLGEEATTLAEGMQAAGYRTALIGFQAQLTPRFGLAQGFDFYANNTNPAERINWRFFNFLDEEPGKAFFVYLHYLEIHWPYCPPPETFGRFDSNPFSMCDGWRKLREDIHSGAIELSDADRKALAARYAEELLALDGELGELFAEMKRRNIFDDTLIVVTADHGEELMERGGIEHGHTLYEELLRVPYVWKVPADWTRARGRVEPALVEIRSLLPTLFELTGQSIPEAVSAPSLLPWVLGRPPAEPPYRHLVAEANGMIALRDERWKLIVTPKEKKWQLYDLDADPGERADLAAARPEDLRAAQRELGRWRAGLQPLVAGSAALDDETIQELRNLGYL